MGGSIALLLILLGGLYTFSIVTNKEEPGSTENTQQQWYTYDSLTNLNELDEITISIEQQLENIRIFAKLYGYVRYFHPSDEASSISWDSFLFFGIEQVRRAEDTEQLKQVLLQLFKPIAPTIQILSKGEEPISNLHQPDNRDEYKLVGWEHYGVGLLNPPYYSNKVKSKQNHYIMISEQKLDSDTVLTKEIGTDLLVKIPLILYQNENGTYGTTFDSKNKLDHLQQMLLESNEFQLGLYNLEADRLADIIYSWNIFQHFYPYFEEVDADWEQVLSKYLNLAYHASERSEFNKIIDLFLAELEDGHAMNLSKRRHKNYLPFRIDLVEHKVVVTSIKKGMSKLKEGDVIVSINGVDMINLLEDEKQRVSGSAQFKEYFALKMSMMGRLNQTAKITIERDGEQITLDIEYSENVQPINDFNFPTSAIYELEPGIFYVNMESASATEYLEKIEKLQGAKGIIYDFRLYPNWELSRLVIQHLIEDKVYSPIFEVPLAVYPDQESLQWKNESWALEPLETTFAGEAVFLSYGGSISRPEVFLGMVEHYGLGDIVGQPSAGANGDINPFILPFSKLEINWTGLKVRKHDGSQHHNIGILPTVPVERTLEAVKEGRDEYIEAAIRVIKDKK